MKWLLPVCLFTLFTGSIIIVSIKEQNNIASGSNSASYGYLHFNWSKPDVSDGIMKYWREIPIRKQAVKNIVYWDYGFMFLYCPFFLFCLYYRLRQETRKAIKLWLRISMLAIIACTVIDFIQDTKILHYVNSGARVTDMRVYTWPKWILLGSVLLCLLVAVWPIIKAKLAAVFEGGIKPGFKMVITSLVRYLARLMESVWLFFPGILFLLLAVFCFWTAGQGKDIIAAFVRNKSNSATETVFNYARFVFFVAIAFWVYISWYSSRTIAYIKSSKQEGLIQKLLGIGKGAAKVKYTENKYDFEPGADFLDEMPRLIGNACFLILELAVLQCPVLEHPISSGLAWIILINALIVLHFVDQWIEKRLNKWIKEKRINDPFRRQFKIIAILITALIVGVAMIPQNGQQINTLFIYVLFALLVALQVVFIFFIHLRRVDVEDYGKKTYVQEETGKKWIKTLMNFFCIPLKEYGYFSWQLFFGLVGVLIYLAAVYFLPVARILGPFPIIVLAFGVLLSFGNLVTALSVRFRINFHLLLFLIALMIGKSETHNVRTVKADDNYYAARPDLRKYLTAWVNDRIKDTATTEYNAYFIMANGGASRSGYWTASVLGKLEDGFVKDSTRRFSDHIFCLSGTSGGGVGVAAFFSMLKNKTPKDEAVYERSAKEFLKEDYFSFTFARLLGPDFFNYIFHMPWFNSKPVDRAAMLERSFEYTAANQDLDPGLIRVPFNEPFRNFRALTPDGKHVMMPILCINTTRMQDGNPGVVTNLLLDRAIFNNRVDVVKLLDSNKDISITSGAILGARFPYISPAGNIKNNYFVDGGYFDNSGAGVVQEMIQGILDIANELPKDDPLRKKIERIHFRVLHIVNSPIIPNSNDLPAVAPIKNDLLSPVLTILGAYDMQTTVNDNRLINFIEHMKPFANSKRADYTKISLYEDEQEWDNDKLKQRYAIEPSYAMNWFISDTTLHRINKRLDSNRTIYQVLDSMGLQR